MSVTASTQVDPAQRLATAQWEVVDSNHDGKVAVDEFGSFLARLLSSANTISASASGSIGTSLLSTSSVAPLDATPPPPGGYTPMPGWDTQRLNDRNDNAPEYLFARWVQANALSPTTENLQKFVDTHPDWEMRGSDQIRMRQSVLDRINPGRQSVWQDVIRDVNGPGAQWQFLNAE